MLFPIFFVSFFGAPSEEPDSIHLRIFEVSEAYCPFCGCGSTTAAGFFALPGIWPYFSPDYILSLVYEKFIGLSSVFYL